MKNIFGGVIFGGILTLVGSGVLWWNEGNFVKEAKKLSEGKEVVVQVNASGIDFNNDGKLVFVNEKAVTKETLVINDFKISENAIKLKQNCEIYQYKESKSKDDEVEYKKVWSSSLINSDQFINEVKRNPKIKKYDSSLLIAKEVYLGDFRLNDKLKNKINSWEPIQRPNETIVVNSDTFQIVNNTFYLSKNPEFPEVGDVKIDFEVIYPNKELSIAAQQNGNNFTPFHTENGRTIQELKMGNYDTASFFQALDQQNSNMNWAFRVGGFFMLFFAFKSILSPLVKMGRVIPFLGRIVGMGTSLIAGILAGGISFILISISWLFYRPLIGIGMLLLGIGAIIYLKKKGSTTEATI